MVQPVLSIQNVTKKFGEFRAVDNLSLNVDKGKITLIIGSNGSGKTTLLNSIYGIYKVDEGSVIYNGEDITNMKTHKIVEKGMVRTYQVAYPFTRLTVLENLLVSYQNHPGESFIWSPFNFKWVEQEKEAIEKAYRILELLEITELADNPAYAISGGQGKLLEIGRALMADAKMILTDEPAGSVSPPLAEKIFGHIRDMSKNQGVEVLVVEHRLDIAAKYVDYVYAMDRGKVIAHGSPQEVFENKQVIDSYLKVKK